MRIKKGRLNIARICCFTLGTALLLSALFLVMHNVSEDRKGGEQAGEILSALKSEIPEYIPEQETLPVREEYDLYAEYEEPTVPEMETVELDGGQYIGYVTIPALDIELPVSAEWSYPNLKASPCRYTGDIYSNDLIICAHNYNTHFGRIGGLNIDDEIIFTDTGGKPYTFLVNDIVQLPGTAVEDMQFGDADDWDITLFTCTLDGQSRVTVRAVRADN